MDQYTGFARVYDEFMDNVPYDKWAQYLQKVLNGFGISDGIVCELGCGTGEITRRMRDFGFDMIGIDNSSEMLEAARCKESSADDRLLYLQQDMREFELYGSVAAVISVCDSLNYILSKRDMMRVFRRVNNFLDIGGVFFFDLHTEHYYRDMLADSVICDNRSDSSLIWENSYDRGKHLNYFDITVYSKEDSGSYSRFDETHVQRAYSVQEIEELLKKAGMELLWCRKAYTNRKHTEDDARICFAARTLKKSDGIYAVGTL